MKKIFFVFFLFFSWSIITMEQNKLTQKQEPVEEDDLTKLIEQFKLNSQTKQRKQIIAKKLIDWVSKEADLDLTIHHNDIRTIPRNIEELNNIEELKEEIRDEIQELIEKQQLDRQYILSSKGPLSYPRAVFSPGIQDVLNHFITNETEEINGCLYCFTLQSTADILAKKAKKIPIRLIINHEFAGGGKKTNQGEFTDPLKTLVKTGARICQSGYSKYNPINNPRNNQNFSDYSYEDLHHKFLIFYGNRLAKAPIVWTGSFNLTGKANLKNSENVVIIDNPGTVSQYIDEFNIIDMNHSIPITREMCDSHKDTRPYVTARQMNGIPLLPKIPQKRSKSPKRTLHK